MGEGIFLEVIMIKTEDLIGKVRLTSDLSSEGDHLYRHNSDILSVINDNITTVQSKIIEFDKSYFLKKEVFTITDGKVIIPETAFNRSINRIEFNNNSNNNYNYCEIQRIHNIDEYYYDYQPSFLIVGNEIEFYGLNDVNEVLIYYFDKLLPLVLEADALLVNGVINDSDNIYVKNRNNFTVGKRIFIQDGVSNEVFNKVITRIEPVPNELGGLVYFEGNISLSRNSRYSDIGVNTTIFTEFMDKGLLYYTLYDMNLSKDKRNQTIMNVNDWIEQLRTNTRNVSNIKGIGLI